MIAEAAVSQKAAASEVRYGPPRKLVLGRELKRRIFSLPRSRQASMRSASRVSAAGRIPKLSRFTNGCR